MLAFGAVWIGLASLVAAMAMVVYRPAFTDLSVVLVLWFATPGALCLGGLVLWAYRREDGTDPGVRSQRVQSIIGMCMALVAAAIVYLLIIFAVKLDPIEPAARATYNPTVQAVPVRRIDTHGAVGGTVTRWAAACPPPYGSTRRMGHQADNHEDHTERKIKHR